MKLKTFLIGLFIVGLVASMYSAPKTLLMNLVFEGTPAPYNTAWDGTSELAKLLRNEGYTVTAPTSWEGVEELLSSKDYERLILVEISPQRPIGEGEATLVENAVRNGVSLLVADEDTTSNALVSRVSRGGLLVSGRALLEGGTPYVPALVGFAGHSGLQEAYTIILSYASDLYPGPDDAEFAKILGDAWMVGVSVNESLVALGYDYPGGGGAVALFSDGTIFLNTALTSGNENYTRLVLGVFERLRGGVPANDTLVVIDCSHYDAKIPRLDPDHPRPSQLKGVPLPIIIHPSMFIYILLVFLKAAEKAYFDYLKDMPSIGLPVLLAVSYLAYRRLRGAAGGVRDDTLIPAIPEVEVIAETGVRTRLASGVKLGKREALQTIHDLLLVMDYVFDKALGFTFTEAYRDPRLLEEAARVLEVDPGRLESIASKLVALDERYRGLRRFTPIVLRWNRTVSRLIAECEEILVKLGYTLTGERGGEYKGVEYGVRRI